MRVVYQYTKCTHEDLIEMTRWLQNRLNLRDWSVDMYTGDQPKWAGVSEEGGVDLGCTVANAHELKFKVWVGLDQCRSEGRNPYQILAHELLHCMFEANGVQDEVHYDISVQDKLAYTLDAILYERYCQVKKKRLAKTEE